MALLSRRGRFTVAKPLFEPGEQIALDRKVKAREGQIAWVEFRGGRARMVRSLGLVTNARDVCEALALERLRLRGFRRRLRPKPKPLPGRRRTTPNGAT